MPTFGFPLKVIKMVVMRTISSLLRSTLLPQFTTIRNAVTAILHVEGKFHVSLSSMVIERENLQKVLLSGKAQ